MKKLILALAFCVSTTAHAEVVGHPHGCPRILFCGCGVSVRVFGHPIRDLFLAKNWFRYRRTQPRAGTVAVRKGHVFYIEYMIDRHTAMAYDPNSGGHRTRRWARSIRGYTIVDPNGNRVAKHQTSTLN